MISFPLPLWIKTVWKVINWLSAQYAGRDLINGPDDGLVPVWSAEIRINTNLWEKQITAILNF